MRGYIHIYTGDGKGKTTAAIGLALRAAGAGRKVYIGQFIKGMHYSELSILVRIPEISIHQFGRDCFIDRQPTAEDISFAQQGLQQIQKAVASGQYQLVILDEINIALYYRLLPIEKIIELIINRPEGIELVLTGRNAPAELIDMADLVTEMKEIKHYYSRGVQARAGIEF